MKSVNLKMVVQEEEAIQHFDLQSVTTRGSHCRWVNSLPIVNRYHSKNWIHSFFSIAISRVRAIFFVIMLITLSPLTGYYDYFEETLPQPEIAIDPSIQAKFAMSMILVGVQAEQYALGGFYENSLMQDQASRKVKSLILANTEIFLSAFGEAWVDKLNSLALNWWEGICVFADSKNGEEEKEAAEEMNAALSSIYFHFKEVSEGQGEDHMIPDQEILDGLGRILQYMIVKGRQGEFAETDPVLFINGIDTFARFAARLLISSN